jgi:excisionase family DNA binding protein
MYYFDSRIKLGFRAPKPMNDPILTVKEVAEYLKVNERTIYRLATEKKIPAFRVGASWRFRKEDVDKWTASQQETKG